jgi:hypothetical protein
LVGSIAAILIVGIAFVAISAQGFDGVFAAAAPAEAAALPASAAPAGNAYKCAQCGVVESTREIEDPDENAAAKSRGRAPAGNRGEIQAKPFRNYEIIIRMRDGSIREIRDPRSARWRQGERVIVIAGMDQ